MLKVMNVISGAGRGIRYIYTPAVCEMFVGEVQDEDGVLIANIDLFYTDEDQETILKTVRRMTKKGLFPEVYFNWVNGTVNVVVLFKLEEENATFILEEILPETHKHSLAESLTSGERGELVFTVEAEFVEDEIQTFLRGLERWGYFRLNIATHEGKNVLSLWSAELYDFQRGLPSLRLV